MDYECHITVNTEHAEKATVIAKDQHWKTSEIARDPVLGNKNFFYLTTHSDTLMNLVTRMRACVEHLELGGVPVLREKVEAILHDVRYKV
jgi:hypothetical protein